MRNNLAKKKKDEQETIIYNVLYVPLMTNNLINLGQYIHKEYTMKQEDKYLKMFDESSKLILKAPLSTNGTFNIMINMLDHQYIVSTIVGGQNWTWHQRFYHLNFRSLGLMHIKKMGYGISKITMPKQLYE